MTKIEWAELSINPLQDTRKSKPDRHGHTRGYHCTRCAPECLHCYAARINNRFGNRQPFDDADVEFEIVWPVIERLQKRRKPSIVFVESMGDLFHRCVTDAQVFTVFDTLREINWHRYIFLTKRGERMEELTWRYCISSSLDTLPSNWIGMVTAGTQATYNEQVRWLLRSPFRVRGVSCEPLLEMIDASSIAVRDGCGAFTEYPLTGKTWKRYGMVADDGPRLNLIIAGAETGPGKRTMELDWARSLRDQCQDAGIKFFFKKDSHGNRLLDGRSWEEWPE